eukprot:15366729-Ditylum_brightwellii.AAC.1
MGLLVLPNSLDAREHINVGSDIAQMISVMSQASGSLSAHPELVGWSLTHLDTSTVEGMGLQDCFFEMDSACQGYGVTQLLLLHGGEGTNTSRCDSQ